MSTNKPAKTKSLLRLNHEGIWSCGLVNRTIPVGLRNEGYHQHMFFVFVLTVLICTI